jgi:hypothetical protein
MAKVGVDHPLGASDYIIGKSDWSFELANRIPVKRDGVGPGLR